MVAVIAHPVILVPISSFFLCENDNLGGSKKASFYNILLCHPLTIVPNL